MNEPSEKEIKLKYKLPANGSYLHSMLFTRKLCECCYDRGRSSGLLCVQHLPIVDCNSTVVCRLNRIVSSY